MSDSRLISADSHFVEPPTMWAERLDRRFRDRAPRWISARVDCVTVSCAPTEISVWLQE